MPLARSYSVIPSTDVIFSAAVFVGVLAAVDVFFAVACAANDAAANATRNTHDIHCFLKGSPLVSWFRDAILQLPRCMRHFHAKTRRREETWPSAASRLRGFA